MNNIQNVSVTQTTSAAYEMRSDMFEDIYLQNITTKTIVALQHFDRSKSYTNGVEFCKFVPNLILQYDVTIGFSLDHLINA
jgi:hypothetical protein